jgi:hypothetical protein
MPHGKSYQPYSRSTNPPPPKVWRVSRGGAPQQVQGGALGTAQRQPSEERRRGFQGEEGNSIAMHGSRPLPDYSLTSLWPTLRRARPAQGYSPSPCLGPSDHQRSPRDAFGSSARRAAACAFGMAASVQGRVVPILQRYRLPSVLEWRATTR